MFDFLLFLYLVMRRELLALHVLGRSPATELHLYPGNQHLKTVYKFQILAATSQPHNQSASLVVFCKKAHSIYFYLSKLESNRAL